MWNPFKFVKSIPGKIGGWAKKRLTMMIIKRALKEVFKMGWFENHKRQIGGVLAYLVIGLTALAPVVGNPEPLLTAITWLTWLGVTFFSVGWGHAWKKRKS